MGLLADLGLNTADGPIMCVAAPDSVLAEAAAMKPRPSFASSLLTAEPTARLLWWPERDQLTATMLQRLKWLLEASAGGIWLVLETDDASPTEHEVGERLANSGLSLTDVKQLGGSLACYVSA